MEAPAAPEDEHSLEPKGDAKSKSGKGRPKVEVPSAQATKPARQNSSSLGGTPVLSARREAEGGGNKGLLIVLGLLTVLIIGFIAMTLVGRNDGLQEPPATADDGRGVVLPPLNPPSPVVGSEASAEDVPDADAGSAGDEGTTGTPNADSQSDGASDENSSDESSDDGQAATSAQPERDPTPAPRPDPTPAPRPDPTPAVAPEPPIAVVADPTPAPAGGSLWGAGGTPTPAPTSTPVDANNPWGTATAVVTEGTLIVTSQPVGASVLIDGKARGSTPLSLKLPFKDYEIRVSKEGHASRSRVVKVAGAEPTRVDVALESLAPVETMAVIIASNPGGAIVFVDGARKGPTPLTISVTVGNHEIKLQAPELPDCVRTLGVTAVTRNAFYDLNTCN